MAGANVPDDEEAFGYCTEFILRLDPNSAKNRVFNLHTFERRIVRFGNSAVVVNDDDIVKVHVHTQNPGQVLNYAQTFGEFIKLKIENMQEQHNHLIETKEKVVEMSEYGLIAVAAGDGIEKMFKELRVDEIVTGGQTMNPSSEDFIKAIKKVNAKKVIIFPNNSNIILAAEQAASISNSEKLKVIVIPTKTIPQGLTACMMFNPEAELEENETDMENVLESVKSGAITHSIRDTEINGVSIKANDYMAILEKGIIASGKDRFEILKHLVDTMINSSSSLLTLIYGEDSDMNEVEQLQKYIPSKYDVEVEIRDGGQPVYSYYIGVE
jgi:DAK2 domain fusion protein YloV